MMTQCDVECGIPEAGRENKTATAPTRKAQIPRATDNGGWRESITHWLFWSEETPSLLSWSLQKPQRNIIIITAVDFGLHIAVAVERVVGSRGHLHPHTLWSGGKPMQNDPNPLHFSDNKQAFVEDKMPKF